MINEGKNRLSSLQTEKEFNEQKSIRLKFQEILCPIDGNQLSSNKCVNCEFCQIFEGKFSTNRSLTSLICLYGLKKGSE